MTKSVEHLPETTPKMDFLERVMKGCILGMRTGAMSWINQNEYSGIAKDYLFNEYILHEEAYTVRQTLKEMYDRCRSYLLSPSDSMPPYEDILSFLDGSMFCPGFFQAVNIWQISLGLMEKITNLPNLTFQQTHPLPFNELIDTPICQNLAPFNSEYEKQQAVSEQLGCDLKVVISFELYTEDMMNLKLLCENRSPIQEIIALL